MFCPVTQRRTNYLIAASIAAVVGCDSTPGPEDLAYELAEAFSFDNYCEELLKPQTWGMQGGDYDYCLMDEAVEALFAEGAVVATPWYTGPADDVGLLDTAVGLGSARGGQQVEVDGITVQPVDEEGRTTVEATFLALVEFRGPRDTIRVVSWAGRAELACVRGADGWRIKRAEIRPR